MPLKEMIVAICFMCLLFVGFAFSCAGAAYFVKWLKWSNDILAGVGIVSMLFTAICLCGWMIGNKLQ